MEFIKSEKNAASEETPKLSFKTELNTDSSISMTFDSAADCGYKSGDIASPTATKESIIFTDSSLLQLKLEHSVYDSGLVSDCFSPSSSETELLLKSNVKNEDEEKCTKEKCSLKEIFVQDKDGDTLLHLAVIEAGSDVIFPLISLACHPDFLDVQNNLLQTLLHLACLTGKCHIVRRLVVAGATLDLQDHNGNTPLHIAAHRGDLDCVEALLNPVTDVEIEQSKCSYPILQINPDLSSLINMKNYEGVACVHLAASGGYLKVMECLYSKSADINAQDGKTGRTPLHYAIQKENINLVELLLKKCQANPRIRSYAGRSSLNVAYSMFQRNHTKLRQDILSLLKSKSEEVSSSEEDDTDDSSDEINLEELLNSRISRSLN